LLRIRFSLWMRGENGKRSLATMSRSSRISAAALFVGQVESGHDRQCKRELDRHRVSPAA
jgi:hypothetical protein